MATHQNQEDLLNEMLKIRQSFAKTIESVLKNGSAGADSVPKSEYEKLQAENKKLKYRI